MGWSQGSLSLYGATGQYGIQDTKEPVTLPTGVYRQAWCNLSTDGNNNGYCSLSGTAANTVEVKPDQTTELVIGGKLRMDLLSASKVAYVQPGNEMDVTWDLRVSDCLKSARISTQDPMEVQVRFDSSSKFIKATPIEGG
jgi:hypothetical protein